MDPSTAYLSGMSMHASPLPKIRATTILAVRRNGKVSIGGDGQVTVGETVMKSHAQKVRVLRRLEALLAVANAQHGFIISGTGELIEPDDGILAIGSGGSYALAAARALVDNTQLEAADIVRQAMKIAGEICIYTNTNITVLETA